MKAHEPVDLTKVVDTAIEDAWKTARKATEELPKHKTLAPLFRRLSYFYKTRVYCWGTPRLY